MYLHQYLNHQTSTSLYRTQPSTTKHKERTTSSTHHHMSLYPNILDISAYNTMLAQHYQHQTLYLPSSSSKLAHSPHPHHQMTCNHLSDAVQDFFAHMFAPASYLACTCSTPCWAPAPLAPCNYNAHDGKIGIVVDSDIVVSEDEREEDGGPLCREATIASWKVGGKKEKRGNRRRSLTWLAGVIGRGGV